MPNTNEHNKNLLCLVVGEELRTSSKSTFWQVTVRTLEGDTKVVIWDVPNAGHPGLPHKGEIVSIDLNHKGVRDQRQNEYRNIIATIESLTPVKRDTLPPEVIDKLFRPAKATPEQLKAAYDVLTNKNIYTDINNFAFVMACLASLDKEKLLSCPAGKSVHHAYQGGLIVHTAEVLRISKGIVAGFPYQHFINQDVIYAGATLHDMGKVFTYGNDEVGQPTHNIHESTLGHVYYGVSHIEKIGTSRNVDPCFLSEVMHVVASHHGHAEYGAVKEPSTLEAMIVSQADYLGSRAGIIDTRLSPMKKNGTKLDEEWKAHDQRYIITSAIRQWYRNA